MKAPFDPEKIFSVSEISLIIKEMLEGVFGEVKIEGEISNLKTAASGHIYFDLKDEQALISVVLFRGYARGVQLEEGQKAQISGEISCYIKQGRYQIIAREVATQSKGNLYLEFEKLKEKLTKEGLFDEDKKLPLPKYPKRIGVATSPTGAAIRDILSVLNRRASGLEIIIAPCLVQGEEAKFQIVEAIKNLNDLRPKLDAILVGRGGGSIEDLWAFNEEIVVRAVAASKIPIISCVGHEVDFTLTDFAASLRAPTPSAAAEVVVETSSNILEKINQLNKMLLQTITIKYERLFGRLKMAVENKIFKNPALIFNQKEQRLDMAQNRLKDLSPFNVLKRGYSIVRRKSDNKVVKSSLKGERLKVQSAQDIYEVETI
ncbi:MAG: exodeoxyribonuclease VII large subunit [Campylobacter sp.]|nr:exodeoxyribonuclease VII large subunit [Campylobacter sp.]